MPIEHFDHLASIYDRVIRFDRTAVILDVLGLPASGLLLDAAGGTGRVSAHLRSHINGVVLADLSAPMLAQARAKGLDSAVCAPTEALPFPSQTFERILMVDALHHVIHQHATVLELWRVLKPGGRLVIEEPDIRTFGVKLIALAEKLALMRSHFLNPDAIVALLPADARTEVKVQSGIAWVVAEKLS